MCRVVIVGAGQAGVRTAATLRQRGFRGEIALVAAEREPPYQRPPLSKAFLERDSARPLPLLPADAYAEQHVRLLLGRSVTAIERAACAVELDGGERLGYDRLVLATGARNRRLPGVPPGLTGLVGLRTLADATELRARLATARRVVVVGGGFVGLEAAAAARKRGADVTVVESLDRVMARVVSPAASAFFAACHEAAGVRLLLGRRVESVVASGGSLRALALDDGSELAADLAVVGIGVVPNVELAAAAGLEVDDGIVVDDHLRTSDPEISAIGDCARHPCAVAGRALRLESVQNATDQAVCVARRLAGDPAPYREVPWFWSQQHGRRLQIAGVPDPGDETVVRGDPDSGAGFSLLHFRGDRLTSVESVDRPADHLAARALLAVRRSPSRELAADPDADLRALALTRSAAIA